MEYEKDFVDESLVRFEIEGRIFKYKPVTAKDELEWTDEYMEVNEEGKPTQNFKKVTECKVRNLMEVPYDQETISKIIEVGKEWKDLDKAERLRLLGKLSPGMFSKIINKINGIDSPNVGLKKN